MVLRMELASLGVPFRDCVSSNMVVVESTTILPVGARAPSRCAHHPHRCLGSNMSMSSVLEGTSASSRMYALLLIRKSIHTRLRPLDTPYKAIINTRILVEFVTITVSYKLELCGQFFNDDRWCVTSTRRSYVFQKSMTVISSSIVRCYWCLVVAIVVYIPVALCIVMTDRKAQIYT